MLLWAAVVLVAWIVLSFPVGVLIGRMFAAGHVEPTGPGRAPGAAERVAYLSRVESRRSAGSRWPHEARVIATSRRRVAVTSGGADRLSGHVAH